MKHINNIQQLLLCLLIVIQTSCVKELDLEHLRPDPKLVLNCIALAGDTLKASVSRTWFFTEEKPNVVIKEAQVNLFVNDILREQMQWIEENNGGYNTQSYYKSSYIPSPGDRVKVEAAVVGYNKVRAESVVPDLAGALTDVWIDNKNDTIGSVINYATTYCIKIRDDGTQDNYYLLRLDIGSPVKDWETGEGKYVSKYEWYPAVTDFSSDPLFGSSLTILDKVFGNDWLSGYRGRVFSDELISGKEYTIKLKGPSGSTGYTPPFESPGHNGESDNNPGTDNPDEEQPIPPSLFRVQLYALSRPYYLYLKALTSQSDDSFSNVLIEAGLSEPIRVYSNIEGGLGILGACSSDTRIKEK